MDARLAGVHSYFQGRSVPVPGEVKAVHDHVHVDVIVDVDANGIYTLVIQRIPLTPSAAQEWIEQLEAFPCLPIDSGFVKIAAETSVRYRLSYWGAAIIAAAELLGAKMLYMEDLNSGQRFGFVQVCNPFL